VLSDTKDDGDRNPVFDFGDVLILSLHIPPFASHDARGAIPQILESPTTLKVLTLIGTSIDSCTLRDLLLILL